MSLSRRTLFGGILAALAAPPIVRASSIMPVRLPPLVHQNGLLTTDQINREAICLWRNTNEFMADLDRHYDVAFGKPISYLDIPAYPDAIQLLCDLTPNPALAGPSRASPGL